MVETAGLSLPPGLADGTVEKIQARHAADRRKNLLLIGLVFSVAIAVAGPIVIFTSTGIRGGEGSGETAPIIAGLVMLIVGVVGICISFAKIRAVSGI